MRKLFILILISYTWPNNFQFRYFNYTKWIGQDSPVYGPFYSISFRSCGENGVRTRDFWRDRPALYPTELTCCFSSLRAMMWDIPVSLTRAERLPGPRPSPIGRHDCSPIRSLTPTFSEIHGIITSLYLLITHFSLPQGRKNRTITELFLSPTFPTFIRLLFRITNSGKSLYGLMFSVLRIQKWVTHCDL